MGLLLKMAKETGTETQLPKGYRWDDLVSKDGIELLETYKVATSSSSSSDRSHERVLIS